MKNSDRFLTAFNRIERSVRKIAGVKEHRAFYRVLDQAKKNSPLIRKYEEDLRAYADLRNAIVHNRTSTEFVIAEPHTNVVEKIEHIDQMLAKPKRVGQLFKKRVLTFQITDSLYDALNVIRRQKFTQFPIYEGKEFKGLVTTVGIANWLAISMRGPHLPRRIPTLGDILHHEKNDTNYKFISRLVTIYEAEEIFKQGVECGRRFEALLITTYGKPHQKLLGIVTPIDIMEVD